MTYESYIIFLAVVVGFYTAWNIGANDVANAMGTSVGSRALTLFQAVLIASVCEFLGAVFFGSHVTETLQQGLVAPEFFSSDPSIFVRGMLAALFATGIWLQIASYYGLPVSTTHAICGAIVGFGIVAGGLQAVQWDTVATIAMSWVFSPLLGGALSYTIFLIIRRRIFYNLHPFEAIKKYLPFIVGIVIFVLSTIILCKIIFTEKPIYITLSVSFLLSACAICIVMIIMKRICIEIPHTNTMAVDPNLVLELDKAKKHLLRIRKATEGDTHYQINNVIQEMDAIAYTIRHTARPETPHTEFYWVEKIFGILQIFSACMMAFAHGSNDVSNAMGPLAAVITTITDGAVTNVLPHWVLLLGGVGIVIGLATWGWRVIETIGKKITELTPSRGFASEFGAACTILTASALGCPVSTTHTLVGAVLGVGLAGGLGALNLSTIRDIIFSWIITIPAGAILSIGCFYGLSLVF